MADTGITCPQIFYKTPSEVRGCKVDMRGVLDQSGGEICTGSVTLTATGITAASGAVSTTQLTINGQSVDPGKAITFTASAGTDGTDYMVLVKCGTSTSETVEVGVIVKVRTPTTTAP